MIVILAVALIVVGPDKLPDMARSVAKWVFELKKTVNQVKESLADEENLIDSVQSDLRKTGDDLKGKLLESDHFSWREPEERRDSGEDTTDDIIDMDTIETEPLSREKSPVSPPAGDTEGDGSHASEREEKANPSEPTV